MKNGFVLFSSTIGYVAISLFFTNLYRIFLTILSNNFNYFQYSLCIIITAFTFVLVSYLFNLIYKKYEPSRIHTIILTGIGILFLLSGLTPFITSRFSITSFIPIASANIILLSIINSNRRVKHI